MYGGTPVTNNSFDILERHCQFLEVEIGVIDALRQRFVEKVVALTVEFLPLLHLDMNLLSVFLHSVQCGDERMASSHFEFLRSRCPAHSFAREDMVKYFQAMYLMLTTLIQIKDDRQNMQELLQKNNEMQFAPCTKEEMRAYYKKRRRLVRRSKDLSCKAENEIPTIIEFSSEVELQEFECDNQNRAIL